MIRNTTSRALWSGGHVVCPGDTFPRHPSTCPEWDAGRMAWERGELGGGVVCADPPAPSVEVACDGGHDGLDDLRKPELWKLYRARGLDGLRYRSATEDALRNALRGDA